MTFVTDNKYFCTLCGNGGIPIMRIKGKEREPGHLKKLWCLHCRKETNHVECKFGSKKYTEEDFRFEFDNHNFDENGNRIMTLGELKAKVLLNELKGKQNEQIFY